MTTFKKVDSKEIIIQCNDIYCASDLGDRLDRIFEHRFIRGWRVYVNCDRVIISKAEVSNVSKIIDTLYDMNMLREEVR